ncbi:MAG TPA: YDG domain-containing protein, partial [Burkholderiaceae bacterium]|nr:YDG domain-containing protein [Burkholderiaceae bacterium]
GGSINMVGGSSTATTVGATHGSRANINSGGAAQTIQLLGGGSINLTGGIAGQRNFANISAQTGTQTISGAAAINLTGGAAGGVAGEGNGAYINSEVGNQSISAGAFALAGGIGGIENLAQIRQGSASGGLGATQAITVSGGGSLALDGGSGAANLARIQAFGTAQTITMGAGAALDLTGGTGTSNNLARIQAVNGNQTILGTPDITVSGGASGGADQAGNGADIRANGAAAVQNIAAGNLALLAGAAGQENYAGLHAANQTISVLGDLLIVGGGSAASMDGTSGGGARIGGLGAGSPTPTNLLLTVGSDLTLTGGSVAGSAIGSNRVGGQPTTITITAGGDITLNPGSVPTAGVRIGSPAAGLAGGHMSITAGGAFSLSGGTPGETAIRTLGNLTVVANTATIGNSIIGGTVLVQTASDVSINTSSGEAGSISASATSGNSLTVDSGGNFSNSTGAGALSVAAGGRWLVFSTDPSLDVRGGLAYDFKQYNSVFGNPIQGVGNGLLYSLAPTATAALAGPISKSYDATTTASIAPTNLSVSGGIDGDVLSVSGPSAGTYADANTGVGKTVTLNPGAVTITGLDGTKPVYGYSVAGGTLTSVMGEITPANLTIGTSAVSKPYDGNTSAAGTPIVVSGSLFGSDTLSGGTFAFTDKNVGTGKTVTVAAVGVLDGNSGNNYTVTYASNQTSAITSLAAATWTGSADTAWTNPANWVGGVVPDLSNVQTVTIPAGAGSV